MPKKKLTKAQVKKKHMLIAKTIFELAEDKIKNPNSFVAITPKKLLEIDTINRNAHNRVK
tara:strand:+ start:581 stop:760 length:180 start_codon:yes stop_codon:yes gene_type:complete